MKTTREEKFYPSYNGCPDAIEGPRLFPAGTYLEIIEAGTDDTWGNGDMVLVRADVGDLAPNCRGWFTWIPIRNLGVQ